MRAYFILAVFCAACTSSGGGALDGAAPPDLGGEADLRPATPDLAGPEPDAGCAAKTCDDCGEHRSCMPALDCTDALCGPCESGYVEDALGACQVEQNADQCALVNRTYYPVGASGYCGDCLSGYSDVGGGYCAVNGGTCSHRGDCAPGEYCIQLGLTDAPSCHTAPCPAGQVWNRQTGTCGSCVTSGKWWPVTSNNLDCIADVDDGYFYSIADRAVVACDQDGDGWLNKDVGIQLKNATDPAVSMTPDYAVLLNMRCRISIASVELVNEWGQHYLVKDGDLNAGQDVVQLPLALYESPKADRDAVSGLPPQSINTLTKGCIDDNTDLNGNGQKDLVEHQSLAPTGDFTWANPYKRLTHYVELHTSTFTAPANQNDEGVQACPTCAVAPLPKVLGTLTIQEKPREGTAMTYDEGESATTDYWKHCWRRRDGGYNPNQPLGYDFGWTIPDSWTISGSFPIPTNALPVGYLRPHAESGATMVTPSLTDSWRGMGHFSQFTCAKIVENQGAVSRPYVRSAEVQGTARIWDALDCQGITAGKCVFNSAPGSGVHWLARRFQQYKEAGDYGGGCIDEATEWKDLCPGDKTAVMSNARDFGLISCGPPCPAAERLGGFVGEVPYWICMHPVASAFPDGSQAFTEADVVGGWRVTGEVPAYAEPLQPLESADCATGGGSCFRVR